MIAEVLDNHDFDAISPLPLLQPTTRKSSQHGQALSTQVVQDM